MHPVFECILSSNQTGNTMSGYRVMPVSGVDKPQYSLYGRYILFLATSTCLCLAVIRKPDKNADVAFHHSH